MGQIDLFKNYSYWIGPCAKKNLTLIRINYTKNVNINVINHLGIIESWMGLHTIKISP